MNGKHLTAENIELFIENESSERTSAAIGKHLAGCIICRMRVARSERIEDALLEMPREQPPQDLATRINAMIELHVAEMHARRAHLPFITLATIFSMLLVLWFGFQMVIALQENGALAFVSLFTSYPELVSAYSSDALFALIESLPIVEIVLTLLAILIVIALAQEWVTTLQLRTSFNRNGRG